MNTYRPSEGFFSESLKTLWTIWINKYAICGTIKINSFSEVAPLLFLLFSCQYLMFIENNTFIFCFCFFSKEQKDHICIIFFLFSVLKDSGNTFIIPWNCILLIWELVEHVGVCVLMCVSQCMCVGCTLSKMQTCSDNSISLSGRSVTVNNNTNESASC